jgi:surfeit locus 1 family protein
MPRSMPNATNPPATPSLRHFLRRVLPTLATIAGVALFVAAGHWQQGRMHDKEALRAQQDAAAQSPPLEFAELHTQSDWASLRYRRVFATGTFDARRQILVDNKVHDGRVGYDVVTPLMLADGRTVLVDRGWIAQGVSRAELPSAPPPEGVIGISGRIALPASGYLELERESGAGPVWQNLDPARFAAASGIAVLPVVIEQIAPMGPDSLVRDWPAPDSGVEKHRIYMMQWYAFAGLAVALWLYFHLWRTGKHDG